MVLEDKARNRKINDNHLKVFDDAGQTWGARDSAVQNVPTRVVEVRLRLDKMR